MNRNDAIIRKSVTSRANIDDLSSESTMNSFITTTTVMNTSPNRKHCHASDKVIKLLALYLQQANSEQELYDNGTIVSLSTYHLEKLNEKLSDFELTQKREANQNKILKWIMDNIVNSYDTAQVTNNDLEIIMEKFKTIVSNIEIFYKKLKRFENSNESEKITLDLSYFQFLKEIRITGKSSTCTFNLGSILNSNDSLRQITFYRNVIVDSFDKIVNSQTNKLIFIDCPLLIAKMEKDDCFGKSILEHTESLSIENCEITEINNFIFKEGREWKNLKNFKLSKTNVDKILIPGVNVPNLSDLCLHHNSISNIKFSKNNSICSVNLTVLDLSFNLLENLDYFSVVKLPNLEIADVSNNYLENVIGLLQACDKDRLKQVYLHGNNILEWNQIYPLTYFDSLEALTLVENPLQKEEPDYLKVILNLFSNKTRPEFYFDGDIYYLDALPKYPFEIIDPKSILITLPPPPVDIPPPPTGIPPPPMMGGIPPPPGVPPPPGGFLKPKVKKEVSKTKNIHWKPIRNTKDKVKSVWVLEEEDEEVDEEQKAIFEKLDNLFSAKKTTAPTTKKNPKKAIDDELNTIIDSSLARNLEILVNGLFKYCELNVLLEAINTMNIETLTIDQIKGLSQFVPATEEIVKKKEIVEKYFDNLRPSLLWTWKLAEISILPIRLQLMQHMKTFDTTRITDVITAKLNTVDNLQNSKAFVKLLHMLLKVGNYMNRGKAQLEEAQGFHLNILPKLSDTKSSINPKTTLVHFLAETLKNEKSELFNFEVELESYGVCSSDIFNIKLDMIQQDLKEIQDVRELFQSKKSDIETVKKKEKNHKIEANFSTFLKQCNQSVSEVESLFEKLNNSYKMACDFFHFDPTADEALTLPGDPLLIIVKDFVNHFKKAKDDLDKEEKKNQQALKRTLTLKRIQSESKILNSPSSLPSSPSSPLTPLSPLTPTTPTAPSTPPISTKSVDFLKKRQLSIRSKSYSDLDDENSLSPLLKARASLKKGSGLRNVKAASDFATPEKESIETTPVGTSDTPEKLNSTVISATTENDDPNEEKVTLVEDVDQLIFGTENQSAPQQDESVTPSEIICKNDEISAPENTPEQISIENTPETGLPTVNESIESVETSKEENKATLDLSNPEEGEIIDATKPVEIISTNHEITKNATEMDDISSSTAPYVETKSAESISQETFEKTDNYQIEEEIEVGENEEKSIVMEDPNTSSVSKQSEHENHEFEQLEEMQEELVEENKSIPQESEQNIETSQEIETVFHKEVESDEFKEEIIPENIIQTEMTQIEEQVVPPTETKLEQPQSENVKTDNIDKLNSEMEPVVEQSKVEEPAKIIGVESKIELVSPEPQKPKKNKKNKNKNKKNKKK